MRAIFRFCLLLASVCGGLAAAEPRLSVSHAGRRLELGAADLARLPTVETEALDHGTSHKFRGIAVRDVLTAAGVPTWEKIRRAALTLVVRARAADGYEVVFALAEFDAAFREQTILLADTQDGAPLPEADGPLRFVCPGDKRGARALRQVISLEVVALPRGPAAKP